MDISRASCNLYSCVQAALIKEIAVQLSKMVMLVWPIYKSGSAEKTQTSKSKNKINFSQTLVIDKEGCYSKEGYKFFFFTECNG